MRLRILSVAVAAALAAPAPAADPLFPDTPPAPPIGASNGGGIFSYIHGLETAPGVDAGNQVAAVAEERIATAPRVYASAEYVLTWIQSQASPQLIQAVRSDVAQAGGQPVIGSTLASIYPGRNGRIDFGAFNGLRFVAGVRVGDGYSVEGSFFVTDTQNSSGFGSANGQPGSPGIARQYIQASTGTPISLLSARPGFYGGRVFADADSQLWGASAALKCDTYTLYADRNELISGFQYLNLAESLTVTDASFFPNGTSQSVQDVYRTSNQFYGSQLGLHSRAYGGSRWTFDTVYKLGLGWVRQEVNSFGANADFDATGAQTLRDAGGLYARPFNSGSFQRNKFAAALALNFTVGYNITQNIRAQVGYNIMYLSSVIRPGDAIDATINDTRVPYITQTGLPPSTVNRPGFSWDRASDFWAQGVSFGVTAGF